MTYSLYSISANALSPSGCSAYTYALNGFKPYTRAPWYQFSEQQVDNYTLNGGTNPAFPFMTGAGGWHQVGPMGWLGARVVEEQLIIQPALPPQIPYVTLRTIIFGGAGIKATMNYTHTTITRTDVSQYLSPNSSFPYANASMPFTVGFSLDSGENMTIGPGQTLTIQNRLYFDNVTTAGNLIQCLPVSSEGDYQPGQFPLAAIDGAASTRWQPAERIPAALTIDMSAIAYQPLTGVSFDWGARPAIGARVLIYNSTSSSNSSYSNSSNANIQTITLSNITISTPYNAATNDVVQEYVGNMSYFTFSSPVWSGQYVTLEISGCQATGDDYGATVAEFNLFGSNGTGVFGSTVSSNSTSSNTTTVTVTPSSTSGSIGSLATATISATGSGLPAATTNAALGLKAGNSLVTQIVAMLALYAFL